MKHTKKRRFDDDDTTSTNSKEFEAFKQALAKSLEGIQFTPEEAKQLVAIIDGATEGDDTDDAGDNPIARNVQKSDAKEGQTDYEKAVERRDAAMRDAWKPRVTQ